MRAWVTAAILASSPALADVTDDRYAVAMNEYFDGEITGGWILMGMGVAGLGTGAYLLADGGDRARGASYVTLGFGTAHLAAGVYVNVASRIRQRAYRVAIGKAPDAWHALETKRMRGVSTQFLVLKIVEIGLVVGGGVMVAVGRDDRPKLEGAGYALAGEAAATLIFDIVASRRASRYRAQLSVASDVSGEPVMIVGRTFAF